MNKTHFQKTEKYVVQALIVVSSNFEIQPRKLLHVKTMLNPWKNGYSILPQQHMYSMCVPTLFLKKKGRYV